MKKYDLEPTFENVKKTIINDSIRRRPYLINFLKLLDAIDSETSISLDGDWGSGKTFFIKQVILCLYLSNKYLKNFYNEKKEEFPNQKDFEDIKNVLGEETLHERTLIPVYFNAWKYDNSEEPVLALINEVINTFVNSGKFQGEADIEKAILKTSKAIVSSIKTKIVIPSKDPNLPHTEIDFDGENFSSIFDCFDELKKPDFLKIFKEENSLKQQIFNLFEKLCPEHGDKYIIFIDELDRCKPSFAVSFLEKIKHYFSNDRIVFVFSTNLYELQNTIKAYYGNDFDGCGYLDKFFDVNLNLPNILPENYLNYIGWTIPGDYILNQILHVISYFKLSMRQVNHYLKVFDIAYKSYNLNTYSPIETEKQTEDFCISCLLPLLIYLLLFEKTKFKSFIDGKEADLFINFILGKEKDCYLSKFIELTKNCSGGESNSTGTLRFVYNKIFSINAFNNFYHSSISSFMTFNNNHKDKLLNALSCLANLYEY